MWNMWRVRLSLIMLAFTGTCIFLLYPISILYPSHESVLMWCRHMSTNAYFGACRVSVISSGFVCVGPWDFMEIIMGFIFTSATSNLSPSGDSSEALLYNLTVVQTQSEMFWQAENNCLTGELFIVLILLRNGSNGTKWSSWCRSFFCVFIYLLHYFLIISSFLDVTRLDPMFLQINKVWQCNGNAHNVTCRQGCRFLARLHSVIDSWCEEDNMESKAE